MRCYICDFGQHLTSDFHRGLQLSRSNGCSVSIDRHTKKPICTDCKTLNRVDYQQGALPLLDTEANVDLDS